MSSSSTRTGTGLRGGLGLDGDAVLFQLRAGQVEGLVDDAAEVVLAEFEIHGAGEVGESLHYAVEAMHLVGENLDVLLGAAALESCRRPACRAAAPDGPPWR
jgi:hypothetical protein